jgi:glycosyltransferase involved in cell wall biosynthesis
MTSVTVVVPAYNRSRDLERCLAALRAQTIAPELLEVIVVDDGSTDDTSAMLQRVAAGWPRLRFFRQTNAGPATARNTGIANAKHTIVAFTDDDCVPTPDWTSRIAQRFDAGLKGCLHGTVRSSLPSSTFVHSVVAEGAVITSNLAIERKVFDEVGVFDEKFRAPWCEDADLFYRLKKAGVAITYDPTLVVDHPPRYQGFRSFFRKSRFFQYYGLIARKHPDMEPLSDHADRLVLAGKKLVVLAVAAVWLSRVLPVPIALLISPAIFLVLDAYRLSRIKARMASAGIVVQPKDQVEFILLNWMMPIVESIFLLKGAIKYRNHARQ